MTTFGPIQRVPGRVPRQRFTEAEMQDLGNTEARREYWRLQRQREDEARAQQVFDELPAERQAEIRRRFLAGESLEDLTREVVHGPEGSR
jgi:hypothetical protein